VFYVEGVNLHKGLQEKNLLLFSCGNNSVSHEKRKKKRGLGFFKMPALWVSSKYNKNMP
jgi:hypothetical protein